MKNTGPVCPSCTFQNEIGALICQVCERELLVEEGSGTEHMVTNETNVLQARNIPQHHETPHLTSFQYDHGGTRGGGGYQPYDTHHAARGAKTVHVPFLGGQVPPKIEEHKEYYPRDDELLYEEDDRKMPAENDETTKHRQFLRDDDVASAIRLQEEYLLRLQREKQRTSSEHSGNTTNSLEADMQAAGIAASLQQDEQRPRSRSQEDSDYAAALYLQETLDGNDGDLATTLYLQEQQQEEDEHNNNSMMLNTTPGRAWILVQRILFLYDRVLSTLTDDGFRNLVHTVATDDLVYLAERFLVCHAMFQEFGKPSRVELGYHYTNSHALDSIVQAGGLLTAEERAQSGIQAKRVQSFGSGIYVATNPFAFHNKYGDVGLLVAVLKGNTTEGMFGVDLLSEYDDLDTVIGNKFERGDTATGYFDEMVLRRSSQCLPLIRFPTEIIRPYNDNSPTNEMIWTFHVELQRLMDDYFHDRQPTTIYRVYPSERPRRGPPLTGPPRTAVIPVAQPLVDDQHDAYNQQQYDMPNEPIAYSHWVDPPRPPRDIGALPTSHSLRMRRESLLDQPLQNAPSRRQLHQATVTEELRYEAPDELDKPVMFSCKDLGLSPPPEENCPICMRSLEIPDTVALGRCKHMFHRECIEAALEKSLRCPVCRRLTGDPQGACPSGTLTISRYETLNCAGHDDCGTIQIFYSIPSGVQMPYHPHPGHRYNGTSRKAYLPDSQEGNDLLERLKYAWTHGLTFVIGTSLTTGQSNSTIWGSIHHKTSLRGGAPLHGYPDPEYFMNCNEEMDALGIPSAEELRS